MGGEGVTPLHWFPGTWASTAAPTSRPLGALLPRWFQLQSCLFRQDLLL